MAAKSQPSTHYRPPALDEVDAPRPPAFVYRNRTLLCEQLPLDQLARKFGTPLYVYSETAIKARYRAFQHAFTRVPHTVCYSVKANSNLHLLKILAASGSGFDVVSGGELERVLRAAGRRAAARTVFSGVGKTVEEIDAALRAGIMLVNVESASELTALAQRAAHHRKKAPLAFRVNPDVPATTHPYISTGLHEHKFGVPIEEARQLYAEAKHNKYLDVAGVSAHIGSQIMDLEPFGEAMIRLVTLAQDLRTKGMDIRFLDAGGGLGIPYHTTTSAEDFAGRAAAYAQAITAALRDFPVHLLLEPGRAIVGPTGTLITKVVYAKHNNSKRFLVVDAGMNDLIRPSLYNAHHEIVPVTQSDLPGSSDRVTYDVVGPICETGDFFARAREFPAMKEGDLLAILDAGAYGMSLASNYNSRPRPAEILVCGRRARVIRKRETVRDLIRMEAT